MLGSDADMSNAKAHFQRAKTPGIPQPPENIKRIKRRIAVMSGKGGVGKTMVSVNIAAELARRGYSVGILDTDITGPNVPKALGLLNAPIYATDEGIIPVEGPLKMKVMSLGLMIRDGDPVIWRGPLKAKAIQEFVENVVWGDLDYLVVDLPPGTGDEPLSVMQLIPLQGVVLVTTPQEVALMDVRRALHMVNKMNYRALGVVENMSYFICPGGEKVRIFGEGGGKKLAEEEGIPFLGEIPIDPKVAKLMDKGVPIVVADPENMVSKAFKKVVDRIEEQLSQEDGN